MDHAAEATLMCGIRNWRRYLDRHWPEVLIQIGAFMLLGLAALLLFMAVERWVDW